MNMPCENPNHIFCWDCGWCINCKECTGCPTGEDAYVATDDGGSK